MTVTMEELSAGVQKIFRDAVRNNPPTPSYPVETEKFQNGHQTPNSPPSYVMLCYATGTVRLEEKRREEKNRFHEQPRAGGSS
jgi:hypothetical protein